MVADREHPPFLKSLDPPLARQIAIPILAQSLDEKRIILCCSYTPNTKYNASYKIWSRLSGRQTLFWKQFLY